MTTDESRDTQLMSITNVWVAKNLKPGNEFSGQLAAIRAGITSAGEKYAYHYAARFIVGLPDSQRSAALRAAAIRAINKEVDHTKFGTVGTALHRLQKIEQGDSISEQVGALPLMNVNAAAQILDGLIGRCAKHGVPVNFLDLAKALIHWGDGAGNRSNQRRNRLVLDFYGASSTSSK